MPWFEYEGLTQGGTAIAGRIEANSSQLAQDELARMQIDVREVIKTDPPPRQSSGLREDDLIFFNEQLASLAEAGLALDEGLAQLARDITSPRLRRWIAGLVDDLRRGLPIDQAIAAREAGLPLLYSRVIRAGIQSGELPATLLNLNQHLRVTGNTRRLLWEMASYPLLIALMALTLVSGFFLFIIPQFKEMYADFGAALPGATLLLMRLSDWFVQGYPPGWMVVWFTPLIIAILWHFLRYTRTGTTLRETILFRIPIIGRIHQASLVARFLRSAATALATGIPLPQAMRLSADATGSRLLSRDAEWLAGEVERGHSIFVANQTARIIPPLFGFCVQVAVGREALPSAIAKLSSSYENRALHNQAMLRVILFPGLIIFVGGMLGFIILSMFLPLISLINSISGGG
jgi:type IV pilus assembly protein PilC